MTYDYGSRKQRDLGELSVTEKPWKTLDQKALLEKVLQSPVEASSRLKDPVLAIGARHQLYEAVSLAHNRHYPLVLDPDTIWLTVAQGLANHINNNAEKLRRRFVAHDGKKKVIIYRDEFIRGSPANDWPGAFAEFSSKIKESIGDHNHKLIVADFSTTGPIERAASEVVLMDAMKSFFAYGVGTLCGIPTITLDGKVEDWEKLLDKVNQWEVAGPPPPGLNNPLDQMVIPDLGLEWWTDSLKTVLKQFINAAKGSVDREFWNNIYEEGGGSGGPYIGGWLTWLFPYIGAEANKKNPHIGKIENGMMRGMGPEEFPSSLSKTPFEWNIHGDNQDYEFVAGLTGVTQATPDKPLQMKTSGEKAPDFSVRPLAGWAVRKTPTGEVKRRGSVWDNPDTEYMDD